MVSATYDHIVAMVIVGVIFIGTVAALPFATFQTVDQQQLRNTALNVFDSMLLNVGSPSNWGAWGNISDPNNSFDENSVTGFGLAYANPFSKYVLDPDKVQRFAYGELSYERIRDLLNVQDEYGFRFVIQRPFKVEKSINLTDTTIDFSVIVTRTEDGTPIPNAEVKVTMLLTAQYAPKKLNPNEPLPINVSEYVSQSIPPINGTTDPMGRCEGTLNASPYLGNYVIDSAVAIMEITVSHMSTTVIAQKDTSYVKYINMTTYGDTILLSIRGSELGDSESPNERRIVDALAYDSEILLDLMDDPSKITWGTGHENATMTFPGISSLHPTVLLTILEIKVNAEKLPNGTNVPGGKRWVLIAGPFSFGGSETILDCGGDLTGRNVIAVMRRMVVISDMTYVASISFWRE